jgi:hypothetical protein
VHSQVHPPNDHVNYHCCKREVGNLAEVDWREHAESENCDDKYDDAAKYGLPTQPSYRSYLGRLERGSQFARLQASLPMQCEGSK